MSRRALDHLEYECGVVGLEGRGGEDSGEFFTGLCGDCSRQALKAISSVHSETLGCRRLTMKLVRRKIRRSWAWLSGVFDSF